MGSDAPEFDSLLFPDECFVVLQDHFTGAMPHCRLKFFEVAVCGKVVACKAVSENILLPLADAGNFAHKLVFFRPVRRDDGSVAL